MFSERAICPDVALPPEQEPRASWRRAVVCALGPNDSGGLPHWLRHRAPGGPWRRLLPLKQLARSVHGPMNGPRGKRRAISRGHFCAEG